MGEGGQLGTGKKQYRHSLRIPLSYLYQQQRIRGEVLAEVGGGKEGRKMRVPWQVSSKLKAGTKLPRGRDHESGDAKYFAILKTI